MTHVSFPNGFGRRFRFAALSLLLLSACSPEQSHDPAGDEKAKALATRMNHDFWRIRKQAELIAGFTTRLYADKDALTAACDKTKYEMSANGVFLKTQDDGGAALWISGCVPITEEVKAVAYFTEPLDAEFIKTLREFPAIAQAYYNDRNSLNRIYPWFDVVAQYIPKMNIPDFNFYYLADLAHNPTRNGCWVSEPYVDPAGRGWMVSALAPVYVGNELVGVPGLDVTIATIADQYTSGADAVALFARSGILAAANEKTIAILEMPNLHGYSYFDVINQDTFRPDAYNILKSRSKAVRNLGESLVRNKGASARLSVKSGVYDVSAGFIEELDWTLLLFRTVGAPVSTRSGSQAP